MERRSEVRWSKGRRMLCAVRRGVSGDRDCQRRDWVVAMNLWQWLKAKIMGEPKPAGDKPSWQAVAAMESRIAQLKLEREKAIKAKKKHSHYDQEIRSLRSAILKAEQAGWR